MTSVDGLSRVRTPEERWPIEVFALDGADRQHESMCFFRKFISIFRTIKTVANNKVLNHIELYNFCIKFIIFRDSIKKL
jgi:hypothetical protein